jgi:Rrf2 family protein
MITIRYLPFAVVTKYSEMNDVFLLTSERRGRRYTLDVEAQMARRPARRPDAKAGRMRLTTFSDYSLRPLIYLAVSGQSTIAEISRLYGISETHLNKVIHQLGVAGDIETIRGRGGGVRLARPPETINVGAVVRRTEDLALVTCLEGGAA